LAPPATGCGLTRYYAPKLRAQVQDNNSAFLCLSLTIDAYNREYYQLTNWLIYYYIILLQILSTNFNNADLETYATMPLLLWVYILTWLFYGTQL